MPGRYQSRRPSGYSFGAGFPYTGEPQACSHRRRNRLSKRTRTKPCPANRPPHCMLAKLLGYRRRQLCRIASSRGRSSPNTRSRSKRSYRGLPIPSLLWHCKWTPCHRRTSCFQACKCRCKRRWYRGTGRRILAARSHSLGRPVVRVPDIAPRPVHTTCRHRRRVMRRPLLRRLSSPWARFRNRQALECTPRVRTRWLVRR
jgi:hypothetical protein